MNYELDVKRDYLLELLENYYPLHFFALFRSHELYNVEPYIDLLSSPILDLGCGDGSIAQILFDSILEYGVDVSKSAVRLAKSRAAYRHVFCSDAHHVPLDTNSLGGIFSNCVLEHIPDMPGLIQEVSRLLQPGSYFIATCLSPYYYTMNPIFKRFDHPSLQPIYQRMISAENRLQNHVSVFSVDDYTHMFEQNGMILEDHKYYATKEISDFCNSWDTASKYILPFPIGLTHSGLLIKYLRVIYGRETSQDANIQKWHQQFKETCFNRNHSNQPGVGQILVARKI